jgi:uncharacterized membrane protein
MRVMDTYLLVKTLHIISATIVFGTGIGIANFMLLGHFSRDPAARSFATRMTVRADFLFTLPAVIVQPLSGAWLIFYGGFVWNDYWLVLTMPCMCWLAPVGSPCWRSRCALRRCLKRRRKARLSMRPTAGVCFAGGSCLVGRLSADWWWYSGSW